MRISNVLALAAATILMTAGAAMAETVSSGRVDAHYQDVDAGGSNASVFGVTGAYAAPLGETVAIQVDATFDNVDFDDASSDEDVTSATAHLFKRDEKMLYGVLAGVIDSDDSTTWGVGAEIDVYGENGTAGGRLLYLNNDDADVDFWGIDAHYRRFVTDNVRVEASIGYGQADSSGADVDLVAIGAEAEYQLDSAPVSIFGGVAWVQADDDFGSEDITTATIGIRWNFGQDSLKSRDRSGASLKGINDVFGASVLAAGSSYSPPVYEDEYEYAS